jgi:hypothetical protein
MLVKADHLNRMVEPLNRIIGGVGLPQGLRNVRLALTQQFKIVDIHDNHFDTHTWAGLDETEGVELVKIARPIDLRANPETYTEDHPDGAITYTYVNAQERIASRGAVTETQRIVKPYRLGDVIYATTGIAGGLDGAWGPTLPFEWLANNDSRAWCRKYEQGT